MGVDERADEQFSALFASQYPDLLRFAIRRVGPDAAPDVVADVFLVAWRRRAELPVDAPRPWLFGVATRTIANHLRGERRRRRLWSRLVDEPVAAVDAAPDAADRVLLALGRLRPAEREVLRLTEWEQLSADEAAAVLGCSAGAFRVRLHRARRSLAAELTTLED